jgi:hypothetical protein
MTQFEELMDKIAKKHFGIETLETQNSDQLDFHEVSCWEIKEALTDAFSAGVEFAYQMRRLSNGQEE